MMNDLIARYIYAVTRRMPEQTQADVSKELETVIEDMLAERCGEAAPTQENIRAVLTELGNPHELCEQYDPNGKKCLIGAPYYSTYWFLLKIVLVCVALGLCITGGVNWFNSPPPNWYEGALRWFGTLWSGLVSAFAHVTLLFAVFYHQNVKLDSLFSLDNLPAVPKSTKRIPRWESIFGIGATVVLLAILLSAPQFFCVILTETKESIPIFNIETVRATWYLVALFGAAGVLRESIKLWEGSYNKRVMIVSVTVDTVSALLAFGWLTNDRLMNPVAVEKLAVIFVEDSNFIQGIFANFPYFLLALILFALVLDAAEAVVKSCNS